VRFPFAAPQVLQFSHSDQPVLGAQKYGERKEEKIGECAFVAAATD